MIIQCEQCTTKFRLDDSKVTDKGVKVRCAKCRHVFTVRKEQPEMEPQPDFASMLEQTSQQEEQGAFDDEARQETMPAAAAPFPDSTGDFDFGTVPEPPPDVASSFQFDERAESAPASEQQDTDFSLSSAEDEQPATTAQPQAVSDDINFGDFDFSDAADEPVAASAPAAVVAAPAGDETSFDFGSDNLFGDAVTAPVAEEPKETISFDFQMDGFADSMGSSETTTVKGAATLSAPVEEPFSLGEIDFGDELTSVAVQQVNPDELKPAQELLFAPLAAAQEKPAAIAATPDSAAPEHAMPVPEELPPLSISSRRRQSPLITGLIAVGGVAAVAALGFFGYSTFSGGTKGTEQETGKISIRGVQAAFVNNKAVGDLLVISGEAVNDYKKPRASLQVKGMVYGANGQVLTSKNAYAGNPLTREQLADMPLDKIETAMTNQFGDSLANMEVQPGKSVPFTIVIPKPPTEAKEFGVQPSGSTVATGKQP